MLNLILITLIAYGITNILVFGSIFESSRTYLTNNSTFLGKLVSCMMCTSFWVGVLLSVTVKSITYSSGLVEDEGVAIFLDASLTSGAVWLIHTLQEYLEK